MAAQPGGIMHPDEGTIHAWLDGELPADEGAALEQHIAGCPACAATVAEARGLVAASTRILGALDDVPAVPQVTRPTKATPVAPGRTRRPWWRSPRFAAAAALLLVTVGTWEARRTRPAAAPAPQLETAPMADRLDSAALGPGIASAPAEQRTLAREAPARPGVPSVPAAPPPPSPAVATGATAATPALADRTVASNEAGPPAATAQKATAEAKRADSVAPRLTALSEVVTQSERQRLAGEVRAQLAVPPAASADSTRNEAVRVSGMRAGGGREVVLRAPTAAPMCFEIGAARLDAVPGAQRVAAGTPAFVQLLDVPGPVVRGRALRLVRSGAVTPWYWAMALDGAMVLVRVAGDSVEQEIRLTDGRLGGGLGTPRPCPKR